MHTVIVLKSQTQKFQYVYIVQYILLPLFCMHHQTCPLNTVLERLIEFSLSPLLNEPFVQVLKLWLTINAVDAS